MYENALIVHNFLRWMALLFVLLAFVRALGGWMGDRPRGTTDKLSAMVALIVVDLQLLAGLLLYFLWSPLTKMAREDMGAAMKNEELRYWAVEHSALMLLAVAAVHLGKILANKATAPRTQHGRAAFWFGLSLALMLVGMAMQMSKFADRPLFRM